MSPELAILHQRLYPTHQVLFHDQTEEGDGDRSRQREGWPAGDQPVPS